MPALDRPDNLPMFIATVWTVNNLPYGPDYDRRIERGRALSADEFRRELLAESADDEITIGPVSLSKFQQR